MTVTLAPNNPPDPADLPDNVFRTITISHPDDHMTLPEVFENLVIPALVAWGFHPDSVKDYLDPPQQ